MLQLFLTLMCGDGDSVVMSLESYDVADEEAMTISLPRDYLCGRVRDLSVRSSLAAELLICEKRARSSELRRRI